MPIIARITKEDLENSAEIKAHFIPASIDGNGAIKIDEYFNSYTKSESNGCKLLNMNEFIIFWTTVTWILVQINALRGYPLKGIEIELPENLQGVVLRESEKLQIDGAERNLTFGGKFDKFTYWNYDKNPSENDSYRKALHWMKVADAVSCWDGRGITKYFNFNLFRFIQKLRRLMMFQLSKLRNEFFSKNIFKFE